MATNAGQFPYRWNRELRQQRHGSTGGFWEYNGWLMWAIKFKGKFKQKEYLYLEREI